MLSAKMAAARGIAKVFAQAGERTVSEHEFQG